MSDDHESSAVYWYAWNTITYRCMTVTVLLPAIPILTAAIRTSSPILAKNALTAGDYKPGKGYTFFHSIGDEVVPYCNFESVCNAWGVSSIEALTYQSKTTLHVGTGRAFYLRYSGGLVDEILDNKWSPREETIGGGLWAEQK